MAAIRCKVTYILLAVVWTLICKTQLSYCQPSTSKSIIATLDARWASTPLLLEASEYLAGDSNEKFWKFVDLSHTVSFSRDSDEYQHIIKVAEKLLAPLGLDFLQFSLSLRYYSPRVELFNRVAHEIPAPDCEAFIQLGTQTICDVTKAVSVIKQAENVPVSQSFEFDHHYPKSENNSVAVVLYAMIGSESFWKFHQHLEHLAKYENVHYILRHYLQSTTGKKMRLSGYGVELAVKKTEYKAVDDSKVKDDTEGKVQKTDEADEDEVEGFLFEKLRKLYPGLKENLEQFRKHLKEGSQEMAALKVWQLQDLSFQAAQRVMSSDPQGALKVLRDISQNLPMQTRSLVKTKVKEEMRKEIQLNQKHFAHLGIDAGDSALLINGLLVPVDDLNPFQLLDLLRDEALAIDRLASLGIKGDALGKLVSLSTQPEHESFVLDARHDSIVFINDLEKDRQYWGWPSELQEILRPTFPGMMRYIAKNIFNLVFFVNPVDSKSIELLKVANELLHNSFPVRFGLCLVADVPVGVDAKTDAAVGITRAFSFIVADKDPRQAFDWLLQLYDRLPEGESPSAEKVMDSFSSWYSKDETEEVFGEDTEYDEYRKSSQRFFGKTGLHKLPQVILNGVQIDEEEFDSIDEAIIREVMMQTGPIQHAVFSGAVYRYSSVYEYLMSQPNVVPRVNAMVQSMERPYIDLTAAARQHTSDVDINNPEEFTKLDNAKMVSVVEKDLKYFTKQGEELSLKPVTNWVIADLSIKEGRALVMAALKQMKSSSSTRVGLIHNPVINQTDNSQQELLELARTVEAVLASKSHVTPAMLTFMESLLAEDNDFDKLSTVTKAMVELLTKISGLKVETIKAKLMDKNLFKGKLFSHQAFCRQVVNLRPGESALITNGRVLGPLAGNTLLTEDDFKLLESFDMDLYARKVRDQVDEMIFEDLSADDDTSEFRSDIIMKASSALIRREKRSRQEITFKGSDHSVMGIKPKQEGASFDIVVVVDPLSKAAQKIAPILMVLQNATNVNVKLAMNSREKLSELPLNRFYRYVLEPYVSFDENGAMTEGPFAMFSDMPQSVLLTMGMDTPLGWMVAAVYSPYDLDNIRLREVENQVMAKFELEYIFIEGHCSDFDTRQPPRGLQFTLGTPTKPVMFDTIVMANLGYFQLKAYPGAWSLSVREGRSSEIYDIESVSGSIKEDKHFTVVVDSFIGKLMKVKVKRKPGMEGRDLLGDSDAQSRGIWDSLSSIVGSDSKEKASDDETINVFSVASGHLYERFLRIMMLTVIKNTKNPVKFWFLKNYLSPTIKAFLPHMAEEYGFKYELVQYHWPHWLHAQTEKQRIIWGYKILFLDVLFPLHVKKIIFVDADLIVRADLKELNDMDLYGAPYAYTPFCSSRKEMDGFRFWNVGYWRSHLGGRPYHISALYVVDLDRFRRIAAGDRLRGQYQGLSQDPNSLSNLDQDLPNNMIHQVPIRSLPQEWLWCETWCDDESKSRAKAIDLCNNPMTKEPKLESAVRIVKEWPDFDNEIRKLQESVAAKMASAKSQTATPSDSSNQAKDEL